MVGASGHGRARHQGSLVGCFVPYCNLMDPIIFSFGEIKWGFVMIFGCELALNDVVRIRVYSE